MDQTKDVLPIRDWGIEVLVAVVVGEDDSLTIDIDYEPSDLEKLQVTVGELEEKVNDTINEALERYIIKSLNE